MNQEVVKAVTKCAVSVGLLVVGAIEVISNCKEAKAVISTASKAV